MARYVHPSDIQKLMREDVDRLKSRSKDWYKTKPKTWGMTTGLDPLDKITGGLVREELITLAGAPGSGKTSLGIQMTEYTAAVHKAEGSSMMNVIVSAEMPRSTLYLRSACRMAGLDSTRVRIGDITEQSLIHLHACLDKLLELPILIVDNPGMTSLDVRSLLSMLNNDGIEIGVCCVDYLQRLADDGEGITRISTIMKNLGIAKSERGCCMLVLSQYTREKEKNSRAPILQDLFGGSQVENDSDQVWALHHPDPAAKFTAAPVLDTELHVLKNRNGKLGIVRLQLHKVHTKFLPKAEPTR